MSLDQPRILVIDDEPAVLDFLRPALSQLGFEVTTAQNGIEGIALYSERTFDLVLVDLQMPKMDGIEVIHQLKTQRADVLVIVITAYASIQSAVEAMKAGAVDYLTKPLELDYLRMTVTKTLEHRRQAEELSLLKDQVANQSSFEGLIGVSSEMQKIYALIHRLADSDTTVLIQGETGTGKGMVARAIHNRSGRRKQAFIAINCGALTETILESELFGHEKGAFTGAIRQKLGLIERAEGGTLFLDEIEEMSPALQVKLLQAIQEREVLRVGASQPIQVDFRLIAATQSDLREQVEQGGFRADLFYRLSVVVMNLPPLRERAGDTSLLAKHFVVTYAQKIARPVLEITLEAMMLLQAYRWPGNVRELENTIEQAVVLNKSETISIENLPTHIVASADKSESPDPYELPLREARERFERKYLEERLVRAEGRVAEAARQAGINRQHFYEKMKRYGVSRE